MIQTIWEYDVRTDFIAQFQNAYGAHGDWAKLFNKCPGYIATALMRDLDCPHRFVTIDYWQSHSAFSTMKQIIGPAYDALDKQCTSFISAEKHIGVFECIDDWKSADEEG